MSVPTLSMMKAMDEGAGPPVPRSYTASRETVRRYHEAEIPILVGTDVNHAIVAVPFGKSFHGELELFVYARLSPVGALGSATSLPATH